MAVIRNLYRGFVRLHILYHATEGPVYGTWLMEELRQHGYDLSPGTLYPILHALHKNALLTFQKKTVNGKQRKYYRATAAGQAALAEARVKLRGLAAEILPD